MSFEMVAYEKLKQGVRESIITLIKYYNPDHKIDENKLEDSVKVVSVERQPQCHILLKAIKLLDDSKVQQDVKAYRLNSLVYSIRQDIIDVYGEAYIYKSPEASNFYKSLTTALGIDKVNFPDPQQLVRLNSVLSKFLRNHIFKESNPAKGYLAQQVFDVTKEYELKQPYKIEKDLITIEKRLCKLRVTVIRDAEELLNQSQKQSIGLLGGFWGGSSSKKTTTTSNKDTTFKKDTTFELVDYEKLKKGVRLSIINLIKYYNPNHKIEKNKLEESVKEVSVERQPQCYLLLKAIKLLDDAKVKEEDKKQVLNALVYCIRENIRIKYEEGVIKTSPERSNFYIGLTKELGLTENNSPSVEQSTVLYGVLSKFIRSHMYYEADPSKGYLVQQVFDVAKEYNMKQPYQVEDDLIAIEQRLSELRISTIKEAAESSNRSQKTNTGFWGNSSPKTTTTSQDDTNSLECK